MSPSSSDPHRHLATASAADRARAAVLDEAERASAAATDQAQTPLGPAYFSWEYSSLASLGRDGQAAVVPTQDGIFVLYSRLEDAVRHLDNPEPREAVVRRAFKTTMPIEAYVSTRGMFGWTSRNRARSLLFEALLGERPVSVELALAYIAGYQDGVPVTQFLLTDGWERYGQQMALWTTKTLLARLPRMGPGRLQHIYDAISFEYATPLASLSTDQREELARALEVLLGARPAKAAQTTEAGTD